MRGGGGGEGVGYYGTTADFKSHFELVAIFKLPQLI